MYNLEIGPQGSPTMSILLNETTTATTRAPGAKVDCAKECPCGVPAIPVPDQWLEVMVTGGFKVWHIIFIIIAFVVTLVVVYCCFHRCRIPRTKQEIEADLMRSTLANKFRDYLQELPNEPTTFVEALKKVQDIEEKLEQEDAAAMTQRDLNKKRMGWLKLKTGGKGAEPAGKQQQPEVEAGAGADKDHTETDKAAANQAAAAAVGVPNDSTVIQMPPAASATEPPPPPPLEATDEKQEEANAGARSSRKLLKLPAKGNKEPAKARGESAAAPAAASTGGRRARRDKPKLSKTKGAHQSRSQERAGAARAPDPPAGAPPDGPSSDNATKLLGATTPTTASTRARDNETPAAAAAAAAPVEAKPKVKTKARQSSAGRRHRSASRKPAGGDGEQPQQANQAHRHRHPRAAADPDHDRDHD